MTAVGLAVVAVGLAVAAGATVSVAAAAPGTVDSSGATDPALVVSDATVEPGATATHRVALTDAPDGLAGFELTLELDGGNEAATVAGASYPDRFGMTTDPAVGADGRTITVESADLGDEVGPGATDVTLATVAVTGDDTGSTTLRVTDAQVDADGGDPVDPATEPGTLTVDDGSVAADADGTDASSDPTPGFATPLAAVVLVAISIALAAGRGSRAR